MKYLLLFYFILVSILGAFAQIGNNESNPHPKPILDLNANIKGIPILRLTTIEREGMSLDLDSTRGMLIYDKDLDILFLGLNADSNVAYSPKWYTMNPWKNEESNPISVQLVNQKIPTEHTQLSNSESVHSEVVISGSGVSSGGGIEIIPIGGIRMWSGAINAIPDGWKLCDGKNNTPDLKDRFVAGTRSVITHENRPPFYALAYIMRVL